MHPVLQLIRFDKPVGTLLLMFPCWWGVLAYSPKPPLTILVLFAIGAFAMRSAGCILNDMADRNIDAKVTRTANRPLASGAVMMRQAFIVLALLLCIACAVALALGWNIVVLGACWLPLIAAYPYMKRITFWPQAFLGLTFGAGPLFGMVAITEEVSATGLWLYAASISWTIGYDTIYACQDIKDDANIKVKSTARLFGRFMKYWVAGFYCVTILCLYIASYTASIIHTPALLCIPVCLLLWQIIRFRPDNSHNCAVLFKSNSWVGLSVCAAFLDY